MPFINTDIQDLVVFEPRVFEDERGYFFESFNQKSFEEAGIQSNFVQDNQARSTYGVLRGLHYQVGDAAQAKLVRVVSGKVLDVAVDLRPDSPSYGKSFSIVLSAENKKQLNLAYSTGRRKIKSLRKTLNEKDVLLENLYDAENETARYLWFEKFAGYFQVCRRC